MRRTPIIAGIAAGAVLGLGGVVAADLATEDAEAQGSGFATKTEVKNANDRSIRAIKQGTTAWNLVARYLADEGQRVAVNSPRVTQDPGVGGGLPEQVLSPQVQAKLNATSSGPQGPPGPQGQQGPQGSSAAFATVAANGTVEPERSSLAGGRVVKAQGAGGTGFYCLYDLPFAPKSAVASANIDAGRSVPPFRAGAMTYVTREGETPPISGCTFDGLQVIVTTYEAGGTGAPVDFPFSVWIED